VTKFSSLLCRIPQRFTLISAYIDFKKRVGRFAAAAAAAAAAAVSAVVVVFEVKFFAKFFHNTSNSPEVEIVEEFKLINMIEQRVMTCFQNSFFIRN